MLPRNEINEGVPSIYLRVLKEKIYEYVCKTGHTPLKIMVSIPVYEALKFISSTGIGGYDINLTESTCMYYMGIEIVKVLSNDIYIMPGGEPDTIQFTMSDIGVTGSFGEVSNTEVEKAVEKAVAPLVKSTWGEITSITASRSHPTDDSILFNVAINVKRRMTDEC